MKTFLKWWAVYSILGLVLITVMLAVDGLDPGMKTTDVIAVYAIMASPIGAAVTWVGLRLAWWLWIDVLLFGILGHLLGIEKRPKFPSFQRPRRIVMNDDGSGSEIIGNRYRVDGDGWVYEEGLAGARVGRIDDDGLWRSETEEVIGRMDPDGVVREHHQGFLTGTPESQQGTGRKLGKAERA